LATLLAAIPLVVLGGLVTTLRAGMAEDGWLQPEGYWLWMYPLEKRMVSLGRFVEHHHREFGSLVGLLSIATVLATLFAKAGARAFWIAFLGLVAVSGQGVVGGLRVLENNPRLAFLHGVLGQIVFGILTLVAILLSVRWRRSELPRLAAPVGMAWRAKILLGALLIQVTLGGWYRHGHGHTAIALHGFGALFVVWWGLQVARSLRKASKTFETGSAGALHLRSNALWLTGTLHLQWLLGATALYALFALSDGMSGQHISRSEIVFSTLHVTVGAMLTAVVVWTYLWTDRLDSPTQGS